ncbi:MAG: AraC family transcriptional regulator [Bacteroidales bacterium]|nr:AraC family transcriptional regulator [Bacteroidales bacterium]
MADYYTDKNNYDTALFYYSQLTNMSVKNADIELQKIAAKAFNRSAILYYDFSDYRTAYEFYIKALLLCEKSNYVAYMPRIYLNIGNIYFRFNKFDIAKSYYANALKLSQDSISIVAILNNLGSTELRNNNLDSAFYFLNKALYISKQHGDAFLPNVLDNLASYYQKVGQHDLALYYFRSALEETKKNGQIEMEAACLANLGRLFFEKNRIDSALFYIGLSNAIAEKNNFLRILADNYLTLSEIEKSKGNKTKALDFFEKYANLKDSVFNVDKFSDITQLQRLYEISKTNEQIERLAMEQEIKKRTIFYQKIVLIVLALICSVLLLLFFQKRKLDTAYETLVEKNLEIIDFQENFTEKYKKSGLTDGMQDELLDKILVIMEDTSIVCDTEFSVEKLAELVNSNQKYVSQVINSALKKNFRSFLNNYRIREAQRLFSNQETTKYTIESVAVMVGYKSRNSFCNVFKEVTGVTPNFYLKSIQALKTIQTHN